MARRTLGPNTKGFTLIELLIVIAIIAILAVVVVIVLNPAELLRQSRDTERLSDFSTLNSALNLYATDQGGANNFSMGSSSVTYISIPDPTATSTAGTDCTNLGFYSGGSFHCDESSANRNVNGTGWIPVNFTAISSGAPIGSLPMDPTNQTSSDLYYSYQTDGSTFRLVASPESQKDVASAGANPIMFVAGSNPTFDGGSWVLVPGNSTFGTGNFYVMKYDASCETTGGAPLTSPLDGSAVNGYADSSQNCSVANGYVPVSLATGYPIVDVAETSAKAYCASIGAHLLTNDEYMTIVKNAVNQGSNWYGGIVGTNYVYSGHNDNSPANASLPSSNDTQSCVGTDGPASCGGTGSANSQIRTYTLSNGSVIWDMAGNLQQEVQRSSMNAGDNQNLINLPMCTNHNGSWEWCQYYSTTPYVTTYNDSSFSAATVAPPNSAWTSSQGMGEIFTLDSGGGFSENAFARGGDWSFFSDAGPFTLSLRWATSTVASNVGFRCAR